MSGPLRRLGEAVRDGGKRRSIEDSDGLRKLIWDAENILAETDSGGTTQAAYTLAPEAFGSLISQRRSGATSFHHYDALGSTNKLTDAGEDTEVEYLYKSFGEQSILSGSSANPFTWVGQLGYYHQSDASDYWIRARIMNPTVGGGFPEIHHANIFWRIFTCRTYRVSCWTQADSKRSTKKKLIAWRLPFRKEELAMVLGLPRT